MPPTFTVAIDWSREEAAYEQIAAQVREAIVAGAIQVGTLLPGVRSLASDLGVNFNTVARAYRLLEEQGFVRIRGRSGAEVILPARRAEPVVRASLQQELWTLLVRMRQAGSTPAELRAHVLALVGRLEKAERDTEA